MRTVNSNYGNVGLWLAKDTVVSVSGQVYNEGYGWHITSYGSFSGYVRTDQLRKLGDAEVEAYKRASPFPHPHPGRDRKTVRPQRGIQLWVCFRRVGQLPHLPQQ